MQTAFACVPHGAAPRRTAPRSPHLARGAASAKMEDADPPNHTASVPALEHGWALQEMQRRAPVLSPPLLGGFGDW